jgi:single-strand DNA-binding protein
MRNASAKVTKSNRSSSGGFGGGSGGSSGSGGTGGGRAQEDPWAADAGSFGEGASDEPPF